MSADDVFDVPTRERITDVRSYYTYGWQDSRTPEQQEEINRLGRIQAKEMMLWRIKNKERNMMSRLERRRKAIRGKWVERGKAALVVLVLMVAIPLTGIVIGLVWNAFWVVVL